MQYDRTVIGYHGCRKKVAQIILNYDSEPRFEISENDYDWLGKGFYVWEYGQARALAWARRRYGKEEAAVVGVLLQTAHCFDLMDAEHRDALLEFSEDYVKRSLRLNWEVPRNESSERVVNDPDQQRRFFDNAVLNAYLESDEGQGFDSVRGTFSEGYLACVPGFKEHTFGFTTGQHIQIAIRNPGRCIIGPFRPFRPRQHDRRHTQ